MRTLIKLILLLSFSLTAYSQTDPMNGCVTVYKFSDNLPYITYDVSKKAFITNSLENLKTLETGINTFEINTLTNQFANLFFANNTAVKVEQNSEFRVDLFSFSLKETNSYPYKINLDSYNMNLALMNGSAYFVVNKGFNDSAMLQTPLSNFGLDTGKYWIQVDEKFVIVCILDGTLDVYDNITNKKETVSYGNIVLIRPFVAHIGKQADLFTDKIDTSVKTAKPEQFKELIEDATELETLKNSIMWIGINGKIIAVK